MSQDKRGKTFSFDVCSQCKLMCCQSANPPLTADRKSIIENYLNENNSSRSIFVKESYVHPTADDKDFCVLFNNETGKCSVHPVKPETCKAGPITFDINLETEKIEWFLKNSEICALAELLYFDKSRFKDHLEAAKTEIMRLVSELDEAELKAILKIPEPQTFKVDENELPKNILDKLKKNK